jgi:hypothetical protein
MKKGQTICSLASRLRMRLWLWPVPY